MASKVELYKLYSKALNALPNSPKQLKIRKEIEKLRKELGEAESECINFVKEKR